MFAELLKRLRDFLSSTGGERLLTKPLFSSVCPALGKHTEAGLGAEREIYERLDSGAQRTRAVCGTTLATGSGPQSAREQALALFCEERVSWRHVGLIPKGAVKGGGRV